VEYSVLGEVIGEDRLYINWGDQEIVNVPPRTVAHDGPVYNRPVSYPKYQDALNANSSKSLKRAESATEVAAQLLEILSHPNQADKSWITAQYDKYVMGNCSRRYIYDFFLAPINVKTVLLYDLAKY